jgi:hypothetical protein
MYIYIALHLENMLCVFHTVCTFPASFFMSIPCMRVDFFMVSCFSVFYLY